MSKILTPINFRDLLYQYQAYGRNSCEELLIAHDASLRARLVEALNAWDGYSLTKKDDDRIAEIRKELNGELDKAL